ncbi:MAG: hypothetical protein U0360_05385 [Dehalococcoidia bacterium]
MTLEELAKLRTEARTAHFAAREARAAHTAEMTRKMAAGETVDADFMARGTELQAAVDAAQARFKQLDRQHLAAFKAATAP